MERRFASPYAYIGPSAGCIATPRGATWPLHCVTLMSAWCGVSLEAAGATGIAPFVVGGPVRDGPEPARSTGCARARLAVEPGGAGWPTETGVPSAGGGGLSPSGMTRRGGETGARPFEWSARSLPYRAHRKHVHV